MKKILYTLATLVSTGVTLPSVAQSQATTPEPITIRPVIGFSTLSQAINTLMSVAMFGGALICLGYLILGAYKYLTAQDNAANTAAARQTMINAIIGLILLGLERWWACIDVWRLGREQLLLMLCVVPFSL